MNRELHNQKTLEAICKDLANYQSGIFLTLKASHSNKFRFETQLQSISNYLNEYCYGKSYKKKLKQLRIVATTQIDEINQGLHANVTIMFNNDMVKTLQELKDFIKRNWCKIIGAKFSNANKLMDVRPIVDVHSTIEFSLKSFNYKHQELNLVYL